MKLMWAHGLRGIRTTFGLSQRELAGVPV